MPLADLRREDIGRIYAHRLLCDQLPGRGANRPNLGVALGIGEAHIAFRGGDPCTFEVLPLGDPKPSQKQKPHDGERDGAFGFLERRMTHRLAELHDLGNAQTPDQSQ